ncbi:MAG TPA: neutral zinc metallopeptidase [Candidatus Limnocylindria bacterium]|nr:neutral zinc metallopeptidase [Candidatus Limnocylindria bacterium]
MTFRKNVRLNPRQVRDLRGQRGPSQGGGGLGGFGRGGGGGIPLPIGGGIGGIILVVIVFVLFSGVLDGGGGPSGLTNRPVEDARGDDTLLEECQTGEDANRRQDCRIVGFVNSIQDYWEDEFASNGQTYQPALTTLFEGSVRTGCGTANSAVGPFYCPADQGVYLDLGFFAQLESRFGAEGGPLAEAYVLAHEYGHHIQGMTGTLSRAQDGGTGPQSGAVRVELQADCYAGVWAGNAVNQEYLEPLTQSEIQVALDAAAAVGDDRIQEAAQGRVTPENWTHGSSEQRQEWFGRGYREADPDVCDTFGTTL